MVNWSPVEKTEDQVPVFNGSATGGQPVAAPKSTAPGVKHQLGHVSIGVAPRSTIGRANVWLWRFIPLLTAITALLTALNLLMQSIIEVIRP